MRSLCAMFFIILIASAGVAQVGLAPEQRFLVPIAPNVRIPGAHGSLWTIDLVAHNNSDSGVIVSGCCCAIPEGCGFHQANSTFFTGESTTLDPNGGEFIYVSDPRAVTFSLRIQDISRQATTWGTSLPVVPPQGAFKTTLHLLDVTVDPRFRSALRIYDFDSLGPDPTYVRLRIYDLCGLSPVDRDCNRPPLVDTNIALVPRQTTTTPSVPATSMIGDLVAAFPQLANVKPAVLVGPERPASIRIDIDPITLGLRFWAFASVTNNETQHVTVITPN